MSINRIIRITNILLHKFHFVIMSLIQRCLWKMCGVSAGRGLDFSGWCQLVRLEGSSIIIGENVSFVSSSFINHIGLNRKCSVTTETKDAVLTIGNNCGFSSTSICCFQNITIGNNVRVGANSVIMDSDFHNDDSRVGRANSICIDDNVWIGANVVVMKGVHIGENCIIGMNSIVTKDIPANSVAAGVPCKVIKSL